MFSSYIKNVSTLSLDPTICIGCKMCELVCPHNVFVISGRKANIKKIDSCMECGACATNCPEGALSVRKGVGCAAGIINSKFNKNNDGCCCNVDLSCSC